MEFNSKFTNLTSLKKAEDSDDIIIRVIETEGKNNILDARFGWEIQKMYQTNLIEEEDKPIPVKGKSVKMDIGKNAIETLKLKL